jgi:diadenosine tetraphosphatase ApaH/serine/threonine PP2A family protein phosphatase
MPYLRQLGALDESKEDGNSVVITNYLNSPANCVSSSKFYSVCCIDQCENLLAVLEKRFAAPYASVKGILEVIAALPSDTVQAPREIPASLSSRLEDIASHHGGQIPLHGRLFAQWMHHAYPYECPFPHMSSTTSPMTQEKWVESEHSHHSFDVGEDEIRRLLGESKLKDKSYEEQELPWHTEEELFVSMPTLPAEPLLMTTGFLNSCLMMMAVSVGLVAMLVRHYDPESKRASLAHSSNHKYYV